MADLPARRFYPGHGFRSASFGGNPVDGSRIKAGKQDHAELAPRSSAIGAEIGYCDRVTAGSLHLLQYLVIPESDVLAVGRPERPAFSSDRSRGKGIQPTQPQSWDRVGSLCAARVERQPLAVWGY